MIKRASSVFTAVREHVCMFIKDTLTDHLKLHSASHTPSAVTGLNSYGCSFTLWPWIDPLRGDVLNISRSMYVHVLVTLSTGQMHVLAALTLVGNLKLTAPRIKVGLAVALYPAIEAVLHRINHRRWAALFPGLGWNVSVISFLRKMSKPAVADPFISLFHECELLHLILLKRLSRS